MTSYPARIIRSLLFYLGHYLIIVIFSIVGLPLRIFSLKVRLKFMRTGIQLCLFWLKLTCNIRYQIHNLECVDPSQPSIVLSRHESTWEALAFHIIFPPQINVVKKELKKIPFFGLILLTIHSILIDRTQKLKAIKQVLLQGKNALSKGFWVVIFPGGTRSKPDEKTAIQSGGAMLAKEEQVPVYLVTHNSGHFWPPGTFITSPGIIHVYIQRLEPSDTLDPHTINQKSMSWFDHFQSIHNQSK